MCCLIFLFVIANAPCGPAQAAEPVDLRDMDLQEFSKSSQDYEAWARRLQREDLQVKQQLSGAVANRRKAESADHWRTYTRLRLIKSQRTRDLFREVPVR